MDPFRNSGKSSAQTEIVRVELPKCVSVVENHVENCQSAYLLWWTWANCVIVMWNLALAVFNVSNSRQGGNCQSV